MQEIKLGLVLTLQAVLRVPWMEMSLGDYRGVWRRRFWAADETPG